MVLQYGWASGQRSHFPCPFACMECLPEHMYNREAPDRPITPLGLLPSHDLLRELLQPHLIEWDRGPDRPTTLLALPPSHNLLRGLLQAHLIEGVCAYVCMVAGSRPLTGPPLPWAFRLLTASYASYCSPTQGEVVRPIGLKERLWVVACIEV
eukprot:scaffold119454_cov23-Tisochrysis_lutea.AAC.1